MRDSMESFLKIKKDLDFVHMANTNCKIISMCGFLSLLVIGAVGGDLFSDDKTTKDVGYVVGGVFALFVLICCCHQWYKKNSVISGISENKNSIFYHENEKTDDYSIHDEENQKNIANLRVPSYGNLT